MRERRPDSWELRVYIGTDPGTGRRQYRTLTVHGNRNDAQRALTELVDAVTDRTVTGASTPSPTGR